MCLGNSSTGCYLQGNVYTGSLEVFAGKAEDGVTGNWHTTQQQQSYHSGSGKLVTWWLTVLGVLSTSPQLPHPPGLSNATGMHFDSNPLDTTEPECSRSAAITPTLWLKKALCQHFPLRPTSVHPFSLRPIHDSLQKAPQTQSLPAAWAQINTTPVPVHFTPLGLLQAASQYHLVTELSHLGFAGMLSLFLVSPNTQVTTMIGEYSSNPLTAHVVGVRGLINSFQIFL